MNLGEIEMMTPFASWEHFSFRDFSGTKKVKFRLSRCMGLDHVFAQCLFRWRLSSVSSSQSSTISLFSHSHWSISCSYTFLISKFSWNNSNPAGALRNFFVVPFCEENQVLNPEVDFIAWKHCFQELSNSIEKWLFAWLNVSQMNSTVKVAFLA